MVLFPKPHLVPPTPSMGMCPCHCGVPNARHASPWSGCAFHHGGISLPLPVQGQHLAFPAVALWVTVALAVCVVGLLAVLVYVCQKKIRQSFEEEEENAGNVAGNPPRKGWGLQGAMGWMEGNGWGTTGANFNRCRFALVVASFKG